MSGTRLGKGIILREAVDGAKRDGRGGGGDSGTRALYKRASAQEFRAIRWERRSSRPSADADGRGGGIAADQPRGAERGGGREKAEPAALMLVIRRRGGGRARSAREIGRRGGFGKGTCAQHRFCYACAYVSVSISKPLTILP